MYLTWKENSSKSNDLVDKKVMWSFTAALTIECVIIYLTWPIPSKEQHVQLCKGFLMKVC